MSRAAVFSVGFLGVLGVLFAIEHFLDTHHYNPGFYEYPVTIRLHVGLGGLFLALALLQICTRIRGAFPRVHRVVGRVAVAAGLVSGVTAVLAIVLFPFSGSGMVFFVAPFAIYFAVALVRGYVSARQRKFAEHRRWMIRALAIASAIATQRLIFLPTLAVFGTDEFTIRWASMFAFTLAFIIHSIAAEFWIRLGRPQPTKPEPHQTALRS